MRKYFHNTILIKFNSTRAKVTALHSAMSPNTYVFAYWSNMVTVCPVWGVWFLSKAGFEIGRIGSLAFHTQGEPS